MGTERSLSSGRALRGPVGAFAHATLAAPHEVTFWVNKDRMHRKKAVALFLTHTARLVAEHSISALL
jgi:hypothetical protein